MEPCLVAAFLDAMERSTRVHTSKALVKQFASPGGCSLRQQASMQRNSVWHVEIVHDFIVQCVLANSGRQASISPTHVVGGCVSLYNARVMLNNYENSAKRLIDVVSTENAYTARTRGAEEHMSGATVAEHAMRPPQTTSLGSRAA